MLDADWSSYTETYYFVDDRHVREIILIFVCFLSNLNDGNRLRSYCMCFVLIWPQPETEQRRTEEAQGMGEKSSREDESVVAHGGAGGEGESGNGEDDWEMVADAEVPETCAAYAFVDAGEGSGDREVRLCWYDLIG